MRVVIGDDVTQFAEVLLGSQAHEQLNAGWDLVLVENQAQGFGADGCEELDVELLRVGGRVLTLPAQGCSLVSEVGSRVVGGLAGD